MDKLKALSSSSNKEDIKAHYILVLKKVDGLPKTWSNPLHISWKRGNKKENAGEIKSVPKDGTAALEHTITMDSTITKTSKGYQAKNLTITLKEEIKSLGPGKKPVTLGSLDINLAQYIESRSEKSNVFQFKDKSKPICTLYVTIQSNWLKINGKSLVKVEGEHQKEIMQELGKQQIHREGSDYFLQTEQDMSEPDQTDIGGDAHDSDGEEDDVSFEDDTSHASGSSVTTTTTTATTTAHPMLVRKSSNLSDERNTSSTSLNDLKSQNSSKSKSGETEESKFKRYKKKLKSLKAELEKSKAEKEEAKKMAEDMEKIKERTKHVEDCHTSEYVGQIDTLTGKNKELESQLQSLRVQSTKDSNEIINLQNEIISLGSQLDTLGQENCNLNDTLKALEEKGGSSDDAQTQLNTALTTIEQLNHEMVQVKGALQQAQDENRNQFIQLEQERLKSNSSESNANRANQENANLKQQIEHSEKTIHLQIDEFEKEKLLLTNEINNLKEKMEEQKSATPEVVDNSGPLREENSKLASEIEKLKQDLEEFEENKSKEIQQLKDSIQEEKDRVNSDAEKQVDGLKEEFEKLKQELEEKNEIIESKSSEIQLAQLQFEKSQTEKDIEINKLRDQLNEVEQDRERILDKESEKASEENGEIEESKKIISEKELLITQITEEKEKNEKELAEFRSKLEEKVEEIQKLNSTIQSQETQLESLKTSQHDSNDEKDEEILQLKMSYQNEKIDLQNEIQKLSIVEQENSQLKSQILEYQLDSNSKQNLLNEYQTLITKLQIDLDETNSKKDDIQEELLVVKNDYEVLKNTNASTNDSASTLVKDDNSAASDSDSEKDKVKKLKSKLKKLKAEMEDKDDEWIDTKIKYEDTIQDLTQNIDQLKSEVSELRSSVSVVPVILDNENDSAISNLREELDQSNNQLKNEKAKVEKLEEEMKSHEMEQEQLKQQIQQLQQRSTSSSPSLISNHSSSPNLLMGDSMEDIKKELEENKNIESSIYWPEIDYDRNSIPYCGSAVWQLIHSIGGIDKSSNQRLLSKIIISLEKSFIRSGSDCKFICYWLSTVAYLLHKVHQSGLTPESADPTKSGIEISISSFVSPSSELGGNFVRDLQSLLLNIYSKLISIIEIKIEKVLIPSIFLPDSLILKSSPMTPKTPSSMPSTPGKSPFSASSLTPTMSQTSHNSIHNLLSILDGVIIFLKESRISDIISSQLLNQTFYFINSQITNYLLTNPKVCTFTQGLEVKMGVSRLKEWCSQTNFKSASLQLDISHEASNLLVLDKNVFVDVEAIKSIFTKLNLHQIRVLLESYQPDELSPEPLPTALKRAMDNNWRQSIDINSLPLQIDSSKKIKK